MKCVGPDGCPFWDYCRERFEGDRHKECPAKEET